jgi:branched-chain amino acid transport system substrate-binding protein
VSAGEEIMIPNSEGELKGLPEKQKGVQATATGNLHQAISHFEALLKKDPTDSETRIYLNNARIGEARNYTIALSVSSNRRFRWDALRVLQGAAEAQDAINSSGGINGIPLKLAITHGGNHNKAERVAFSLARSHPEVLGVVLTGGDKPILQSAAIYASSQLVTISPTNSSVRIPNSKRSFFRLVPTDTEMIKALADYMLKSLRRKKVAIFSESQAYDKLEFEKIISSAGATIIRQFNFSSGHFNPRESVKQARQDGADIFFLSRLPKKESLEKALQIVEANQNQVPFLATDLYTSEALKINPSGKLGLITVSRCSLDQSFITKLLPSSQSQKAKDAEKIVFAYDALQVFIAALKQHQNPTRSKVRDTISNTSFNIIGVTGAIKFLRSGDRNFNTSPIRLMQVQTSKSSPTGYDFVPIQ